jgi:hypothetical protein
MLPKRRFSGVHRGPLTRRNKWGRGGPYAICVTKPSRSRERGSLGPLEPSFLGRKNLRLGSIKLLSFLGFHKIKKMREVHAGYIAETPSFVHVSMDITPADANKSSYSYGPWILRKAEEPEPVSTSTYDKRAWKLPNRIWSFGGHSVKNNSNNSNNSNNHTKNIFANVGKNLFRMACVSISFYFWKRFSVHEIDCHRFFLQRSQRTLWLSYVKYKKIKGP